MDDIERERSCMLGIPKRIRQLFALIEPFSPIATYVDADDGLIYIGRYHIGYDPPYFESEKCNHVDNDVFFLLLIQKHGEIIAEKVREAIRDTFVELSRLAKDIIYINICPIYSFSSHRGELHKWLRLLRETNEHNETIISMMKEIVSPYLLLKKIC